MGNLCPVDTKKPNGKKQELELQEDIKVLLLGAGDSGKSTIFKQMKFVHENGFTDNELRDYRQIIHANCFRATRALVDACSDLNIQIQDESNRDRAKRLQNYNDEDILNIGNVWNEDMGIEIGLLWRDPNIQTAYGRRHQFQLDDSASYYLNQIDRIGKTDYIPTQMDVLRSRVKTTGIIEVKCKLGSKEIRLVDVGGQRSERKKWINCFSDADALVFVVSLSEYDQTCYEDGTTPRMTESLDLFEQTINSKYFIDTPIVLFLNKTDVFKEKIGANKQISQMFPDFKGDNSNFDQGYDFIRLKYEGKNKNPNRKIYSNPTCAMEGSQVQKVFETVKDIFVKKENKDAEKF